MANKKPDHQSPGSDYGFLSITLGASSFIASIFTGIPAIVLGIIALRKKKGHQGQAKAGIALGIAGSIFTILIMFSIVLIGARIFRGSFSVPPRDDQIIRQLKIDLESYYDQTGKLPQCDYGQQPETCEDWQNFLINYPQPNLEAYTLLFENAPNKRDDQPQDTLVYMNKTECFINLPTKPGTVEDRYISETKSLRYSALLFYHAGGTACYGVNNE